MIIGLDFDSTIVTNEYPEVGSDLGSIPYLLHAQRLGAEFILFTMRDGAELRDAANYLIDRGVRLLGVNVNPTQWQFTMSPKAYCHMYIDDRNIMIPTLDGENVDWSVVGPCLVDAVKERYRIEPGASDLVDATRYIEGTK